MSRYTTQLRYICETMAGYRESVGLSKIEDVLSKCVDKIFDFDYPFYKQDKKVGFEKMILRHFYQEEIGFETYAQWKLNLQCWLVENMGYYGKLYQAVDKEFDFLDTYDITTTRDVTGKIDSNGTVDNNGSGDTWEMYQDTPQGGLTGVKEEKYLTTATHNENTVKNIETRKNIDNEKRNENVKEKGRRENPSKLLKDYLNAVKNIDKMVLEELDSLFMGLWL